MATSTSTSTSPQSSSSNSMSLYLWVLNVVNNFLHLPLIDDLAYVVFHVIQLCIGPLYALALVTWYVFGRLLSGSFITRYETPKGRCIVITGCDSGFGYELALSLVRKGWKVYAGCLSARGMQALTDKAAGCPGTMVAVQMDVTKQKDIDRVVKQVAKDGGDLFALVNNAGVGQGGLVDWQGLETYRQIMEVNLFAMIATCKAFLPMLKESKGRIVNVTSMAGLFLGAPCMSAYAASKHAAEAFTTSLRFELKPWGIRVITLNPSFHNTQIASNAAITVQRAYDALDAKTQEEYGLEYLQAVKELTESQTVGCWDPQRVVEALIKATISVSPRSQIIVGSDATFYLLPLLHFPTPLIEWLVYITKMQGMVPAKVLKNKNKKKKIEAMTTQSSE